MDSGRTKKQGYSSKKSKKMEEEKEEKKVHVNLLFDLPPHRNKASSVMQKRNSKNSKGNLQKSADSPPFQTYGDYLQNKPS